MVYTSKPLGLLARKNGQYVRPIISKFTDLRVEDIGLKHQIITNYVGRLPDIAEINQINKYILADANLVLQSDLSQQEAQQLMIKDNFVYLPDGWWEYAMCLDDNGAYIKAPKNFRKGEPSPEEIDERLDEFEENVGRLDVISPQVLNKGLKENYVDKLKRI